MRDPNRIDYILDQLREQWRRHPDYRLGQLIYCAVAPKDPCPEISGIEDEVLLNRVVTFIGALGDSHGGPQGQRGSG